MIETLLNQIKTKHIVVLFNPKDGYKWFHTFPMSINLKVNIIVRLEFKYAYHDVAVQSQRYGDFSNFLYTGSSFV